MLKGICVDSSQSSVLKTGKSYFLFPNGLSHYYVSNFGNKHAHFGCFQSKYFDVITENDWPTEPKRKQIKLDPNKLYIANLIWRKQGYKGVALKEYYINPKTTHCDFYQDSNLNKLCGCFPLHWFSEFKEVVPGLLDIIDQEIIDFDIKIEENDSKKAESNPKITQYVQLSLFDF